MKHAAWILAVAALAAPPASPAPEGPPAAPPARPGPPGAPDTSRHKAAMQRLAYMAGEWHGDGWIEMGRRVTFRGSETITSKLDGLALLVEGNFSSRIGEAEVPVHTTLGVISYDAAAGQYRFSSWLASGGSGERELVVTDDGWTWDVPSPRGTARFVMKRGPDGEWVETGERSADGQTWTKFFEMTLRKAAP